MEICIPIEGADFVIRYTGTRAEIPVSCPTSNCNWPSYETLGVCSACMDVSNLLEYACISSRIDWTSNLTGGYTESTYPNGTMCGYFINGTSDFPVLVTGYVADSSLLPTGKLY